MKNRTVGYLIGAFNVGIALANAVGAESCKYEGNHFGEAAMGACAMASLICGTVVLYRAMTMQDEPRGKIGGLER